MELYQVPEWFIYMTSLTTAYTITDLIFKANNYLKRRNED